MMAFYARNIDQVPLASVLPPLVTSLLLTLLVFVIALVPFRNVRKAALLASAISIAMNSYGPLSDLFAAPFVTAMVIIEVVVVGLVLWGLIETKQPLRDSTIALNAASLLVVATSGWSIGAAYGRAALHSTHVGERIPSSGAVTSDAASAIR